MDMFAMKFILGMATYNVKRIAILPVDFLQNSSDKRQGDGFVLGTGA